MDLLKAELERKRRAVAEHAPPLGTDRAGKKKRYLTAAERRRREEDAAEREEDARRAQRRRRRRKRKDDDDAGQEDEDLTTLLTRKRPPASRGTEDAAAAARGAGTDRAATAAGDGDADAAARRAQAQAVDGGGREAVPVALRTLSPDEVTTALRGYGLPVRLFGEITRRREGAGRGEHDDGDAARLQRLAVAARGREAARLGASEMDEYLLEGANRTRNVFLEKDAHHDSFGAAAGGGTPAAGTQAAAGDAAPTADGEELEPAALTEEERNDKPKRIYRYFKGLLKQWEADLALRPEAVRRTAAGKNETKTHKQCRDYIRPLFQECRRRALEDGLQTRLFDIVERCEEGEFVRAHDAYLDVAIGRAAWPIGVTMVGIHARAGRAKIASANVAHVMNSELQRKYLTSVKRLMSYAQRKRPDVHPSKKVMNL